MTYEVGAIISPTYAIAHASDAAWATWAAYGVDYGEYENPMTTQTCGTGPYKLTNWVPDQFIELDLFTDYWRTSTSAHAGSLTKVFIKTNEDVNGRSLNLRTGTTDGCYWPTTNALDIWSNVTDTTTDPNIFVSTGGYGYTVTFFGFNMGIINQTVGAVLDEKVSPFQWLNFRRAASWAMDYEAFLSAAVNGFGIQGQGCIPVGMFGHNGSAYNWEYNITAAVAEWNLAMAQPGFATSLNEMDNAIVLYYNSGNTVREQGCLLLADGLNAMLADSSANTTGLDAAMTFTTQALEWSNYLDYIREKRMPIFFVGWAPDYADPDNYVFPFAYHVGTYAQRISYNDSEVNDWYEEAKIETNLVTRAHLYDLIQEKMAVTCPYLWMYQATEFRTWRAWLHGDGLAFNPMHSYYFYHMYKTYPTA
jgi:peptide/nickel transport system substrate-binding protein